MLGADLPTFQSAMIVQRPIGRCLVLMLAVLAAGLLGLSSAAAAAECENVAGCIPQLRFGETQALRELAAQLLGERGAADAIPYLAEALTKDDGEFVRVNAAQALGRIGTIASVAPLTKALAGDRSVSPLLYPSAIFKPRMRHRASLRLCKRTLRGRCVLQQRRHWASCAPRRLLLQALRHSY